MAKVKVNSNPEVQVKINAYPAKARKKIKQLRKLILTVANEIPAITEMEETLKWGEPSYLVKKGSTVRMDWKAKKPDQVALYFKCTSKIVPSIKLSYGEFFKYEKSRALLFGLEEELPEAEIKDCISRALQYHDIKDKLQY